MFSVVSIKLLLYFVNGSDGWVVVILLGVVVVVGAIVVMVEEKEQGIGTKHSIHGENN